MRCTITMLYRADESYNRTKQLSTVAPVTYYVVTRMRPVMRMRYGSGQTVLVEGGLFFQTFYPSILLVHAVHGENKFLSSIMEC